MSALAFTKQRIVIIDDNQHMRALLRTMLSGFGIREIFEAAEGQAGLEIVEYYMPDLVLTDYHMKPVNGVELVKKVRRSNSPMAWVPIIMVTGHTERRYIETARDAGVTELLCKPVTVKGLFARLVEVAERPRPFVSSPAFVGPDRRRHRNSYNGPKRRKDDYGNDVVLL